MAGQLPPKNQDSKNLSPISLGGSMAAGMIMLSLGGLFLDKRFNSGNWWTLVGISLGFFYCAYEIWKVVRQIDKTESKFKEK